MGERPATQRPLPLYIEKVNDFRHCPTFAV